MRTRKKRTPFFVPTRRRREKISLALVRYPTRKWRGEPDYLIIGAEKAGTTSVQNYILQHPDVVAPQRKEIQYFSRYFYKSWDWYRAHFPLRSRLEGRITGEASPYYIYHPLAAERIHGMLPRVKIIALVREPLGRSVSQYYHEVSKRREKLSLPDAFAAEEQRIEGELERMRSPLYLPFNHEHYSYIRKSVYVDQLRPYFRVFPREQILVIQSERLFRDTPAVVRELYGFLGIDADFRPENLAPANVSRRKKSPLPPELEERLRGFFAAKNEELYELLGTRYDW